MPPEQPGAPTDIEVQAVLDASRTLVRIAARSLAPIEDVVTLPQYRMLLRLHPGPLAGAQLAADLDVNPSTVVRMADRLERKGLVRRSRRADDRRVLEITLSASGRALVDEVTGRRVQELRTAMSLLSAEERAGLVEHLALLGRHVPPEPGGASPLWPL